MLGQLLLDVLRLTPAHMTVTLVVAGAIGRLGLYEPLIKFAGAGASVPISSFGTTGQRCPGRRGKERYYRCTYRNI